MYLQQSKLNKLNTKKIIEGCGPCYFETLIFKDFFHLSIPHS